MAIATLVTLCLRAELTAGGRHVQVGGRHVQVRGSILRALFCPTASIERGAPQTGAGSARANTARSDATHARSAHSLAADTARSGAAFAEAAGTNPRAAAARSCTAQAGDSTSALHPPAGSTRGTARITPPSSANQNPKANPRVDPAGGC